MKISKSITTVEMVVSVMDKGCIYTPSDIREKVGNEYYDGELPIIVKNRIHILLRSKWIENKIKKLSRGTYCLADGFEQAVKSHSEALSVSTEVITEMILSEMKYHKPYDIPELIHLLFDSKNTYLYTGKVRYALESLAKSYKIIKVDKSKYSKPSPVQVLRWFNSLDTNEKYAKILDNSGLLQSFCTSIS